MEDGLMVMLLKLRVEVKGLCLVLLSDVKASKDGEGANETSHKGNASA